MNISIERFDTQSALMMMSRYRTAQVKDIQKKSNASTDIYLDFDTLSSVFELMNQTILMCQRYLFMIGSIASMESMKTILPKIYLSHLASRLFLLIILMQVSCMIYYLEKPRLVCVHSTTRLLLTSIASSNLHLKQLPTVQSSYLEENVVRILLTTEHTSDILESQLVKWTMYGEIMRVSSISRPYLKPS